MSKKAKETASLLTALYVGAKVRFNEKTKKRYARIPPNEWVGRVLHKTGTLIRMPHMLCDDFYADVDFGPNEEWRVRVSEIEVAVDDDDV